ncbi:MULTISPECIES: urea ABC transporter ATP-binding subunit UrtE [Tepidimonas]|uniref:Amino acid transport ATP-binding protein LivF n=2 Tax=Tepidimonas TaxID=114248 RepID=A0A4R3L6D0_9BURK|nr:MULTISPECIES: urea ABC transporter ATP-binding subunit UrtE [Tepidimonas]MCX7814208.1 urea ABC transporter ATP-binding subunit UrtE [Tepidimonas ignava]TCS94575.1 amino acid/amide ABC transporter ATP-binding protein 2 (HAAT family) [Tepidimonas ignava]TSE18785.1 amino acid transport ATP-binding protein LivF [Tepidimonas ignava]TSE27717.1 High-affinity branched-chain amino acid transport ATP-binding protein LivF [Tepidimonas aquatica]
MLQIDALHQAYGGSHILRGISLEARPGEITVILGRNGVGKTTLLKALMGLVPVRSGRVVWEGVDLTHRPVHERSRRGIGYVPQGREIFARLTVRENLLMGLASQPANVAVPPKLYELFPVLAEMQQRRGGDLSGGQQQQLAIARALAARPRLLVLDEPTEGIQPNIIQAIGRVLRQLAREGLDGQPMAILLVEQYYDFARELADRYVVLDRGTVVASGSGEEMEVHGVRTMVAL